MNNNFVYAQDYLNDNVPNSFIKVDNSIVHDLKQKELNVALSVQYLGFHLQLERKYSDKWNYGMTIGYGLHFSNFKEKVHSSYGNINSSRVEKVVGFYMAYYMDIYARHIISQQSKINYLKLPYANTYYYIDFQYRLVGKNPDYDQPSFSYNITNLGITHRLNVLIGRQVELDKSGISVLNIGLGAGIGINRYFNRLSLLSSWNIGIGINLFSINKNQSSIENNIN